MIAAGIAVVAVAIVGIADFSITSGKVPEVPAPCEVPGDAVCEEQRNEEFDARLDRASELEDGFDQRAWFYGGAALAAVLIGLVVALRRTERSARREVFTDLGVASVVGLGAGLILAAGGSSLIETPAKPVLYPPVVLLAVAAIGTLATPRPQAKQPESADDRDGDTADSEPSGPIVYAGLALTAAAVIAALVSFSGRDDPCVEDIPGWVGTLATLALILAGLAAICGLASLIARRWMAALVMLAAGPAFALLALAGTVCWN